jgi:type VII secretion-associated serine protease mycosin
VNRLRHAVAFVLVEAIAALAFGTPASADPVRDAEWHLAFLNVPEAHKYSQGDGVIVGVVDTGVDASHPDLTGNVLTGRDFTGVPGDGLQDIDGHGTGMAGLIAAHGRVLGIAPKAKILPIRDGVSNLGGSSPGPALEWAIDNGARVLSLAFGQKDSPQTKRAIERAVANDIVVVAAVGNEPRVTGMDYPAAYPGVVGAAGVDRNGNHAAISVVSPFAVLAAPAVDILSTDIRTAGHTGYANGVGTSAATAIIAGAAALVRAKYPNLSAAEVIHRLTATADDKGPPGRDNEYGYGVINLVKALTADVPPLPPTTTPTTTPTSADATSPHNNDGTPTKTILIVGALIIIAAVCAAFITIALRQRAQ